jgi:hypothetical protein
VALGAVTTAAPVRLPPGWRVVRRAEPAWIALGPGPALGGISPRVAMTKAPEVGDLQELVRAQVTALFVADETVRALDEEAFVTVAGDAAYRVLTSRVVGSTGLTTDHWAVARPGGTVVVAGAAASAAWPQVSGEVRRALRAVVAAA